MTQSEQGDEPQHPAGRPAYEGVILPPARPAQLRWPASELPGQEPGPMTGHTVPPQGQSWDQPWGPVAQQPSGQPQMDQHQQQHQPYQQQHQSYQQQQSQQHQPNQQHQQIQPQPNQPQPNQQPYQASPQQQIPQHQQPSPQYQQPSQPHPPQPHPSHQPYEQTPQPYEQTPLPHQQTPQPPQSPWGAPPPAGDADATQFMPPVVPGPGALPPENPVVPQQPAGQDGTQFLGQQALQPPAGSDADATQYLPPVPDGAAYAPRQEAPLQPGQPGERQPPAEFDSLFRTQAPQAPHASQGPQGAEDPASPGATQQMPRFLPPRQQEAEQEEARYQQFQQPGPRQGGLQQPGHDPRGGGTGSGRRKISPVPLVAAVVIGCSVIGLGIGALMNSGGDDEDSAKDAATTSASAGAPAQQPAEKSEDPAEAQAVALDKLLADSNNSRSAVINAVASIGSCDKLDEAAKDLRGAASQRRGLVTRLAGLKVDELPDHASLTQHLNSAWKASAAADDHYADWADKVGDDKDRFCSKGKAKATAERRAGDRESGKASQAKKSAVGPWNTIAAKYELTEHQPTDL